MTGESVVIAIACNVSYRLKHSIKRSAGAAVNVTNDSGR